MIPCSSSLRRMLAATAFVLVATPAAQAADIDGVPASYRLSMPVLERCFGAHTKIVERAATDAKLKAELSRGEDEDDDDDEDAQTVDAFAKHIETKLPQTASLMKQFGCPVKDYATMILATIQAGSVAAIEEVGGKVDGELRAVPRENVEFLKRNKERIQALRDKLAAAHEKAGITD